MRQRIAGKLTRSRTRRERAVPSTARPNAGFSLGVLCSVVLATGVIACQVPVFRYALERWPADEYELVILHREPLGKTDQARLDQLQDTASHANTHWEVSSVHVDTSVDPVFKQLWKEQEPNAEPLLVVLYPKNAREVPDRVAAVMPFDDSSASQVALSPVREEIAKRLAEGESAVWIFVPSGHADQDAASVQALSKQLKTDEQRLTLPSLEEMELEPGEIEKVKIELRIAFSVVTLDRNDSQERLTLQLLLGSEADLEALDEPLAFPVFGRGRVLYALVGAGISDENIRAASNFIVGPCSCQVKNQNPGFDLLLKHDWENSVGESRLSDPLPQEPTQPSLRAIPPGRVAR